MIYKSFQNIRLSALGFGNMRLPVLEDDLTIDVDLADQIIACAYVNGVNYFDTAYGYHNGESERFIGRSLARFPRDTWYLASKFPGYEERPHWDPEAVFHEQLNKCKVNYFDFYLIHNVCEKNIKTYLNSDWGIIEYVLQQKKNGRIKHLGFSTHAGTATFMDFLNLYGDKMEFCQIELNALDWFLQEAKVKYEELTRRGIPIWVMEPVRGGKLASFSSENERRLKEMRPYESIAAWAFRWLETLPNIGIVLSGMTDMHQVEDNIKTFSMAKPLSKEEKKAYDEIIASLADLLPCTACRYCCPGCPQELNIPYLLGLYNDCRYEPSFVAKMAVAAMDEGKRPTACITCNSCQDICPQNIDVATALKHFQSILDTIPLVGAAPPKED